MIHTRPMDEFPIAEEKKDDDDLIPVDASIGAKFPLKHDARQGEKCRDKSYDSSHRLIQQQEISQTPQKSPLLLILCSFGITSCYLWYGTVQEHLFKINPRETEDSITLFLLATGTLSSFLVAFFGENIGEKTLTKKLGNSKASIEGRLNHPLLLVTSITYLSAMAASNESLHYVSYPTCVLAKSSKLIPTMVVGWLVDQFRGQHGIGGNKSHSIMEWIGAACITMGIISFQYTQLQKQQSSHHEGKERKGDSPYGLALLGLSLFMDGFLGACQSALKRKSDIKSTSSTVTGHALCRPPSAMETMLYINLYATLLLLPASYYAGQFQHGMKMFLQAADGSNDIPALLLKLNISASLGQVFIFLTIHHFSPLICTTITTTRKFFTILLSVYKFGHVLDLTQWCSIALVFGGLYLEIAAKMAGTGLSDRLLHEEKEKKE